MFHITTWVCAKQWYEYPSILKDLAACSRHLQPRNAESFRFLVILLVRADASARKVPQKLAIHNPSILQRYPQLGGNTSESLVTKIQTWSSLGAWNKSLQCLRHKARARSQTQHLFSIPMIPAGNVRDTKSIKSKWRNWKQTNLEIKP